MGFLPPTYKDSKTIKAETRKGDSRYIDPSKIANGDSITVRPCGTYSSGHVICGYEYFSTTMKRTRRFPEFPEDYMEDIGLTWEGRSKGTGEKDTPKYFLAFAVLSKENKGFGIIMIPQLKLREKIERIFAIDSYQYPDGAIAPFFLTITRTGEKKDTVYDAIPTLKPATAAETKSWKEAASGIYLPALFDGADPFAGPPAAPASQGQPPAALDGLGAEVHSEPTTEEEEEAPVTDAGSW
jgi:hypothetical protein